jgi:hypothetical protein
MKIASATGKLPKALEERPERNEFLQYYIDAFLILNKTRIQDNPISLFDIFLMADTLKEDRMEFTQIITTADAALAEAKKQKAGLNSGTEKPS